MLWLRNKKKNSDPNSFMHMFSVSILYRQHIKFIFKNKCLKTQPTISHFKVYLSQRINVEKHIYFIKNRLAQFDTKWVNLKPLIEDNA